MELAFVLGHPLKLLALIAIIVIAIVIAEQYKKRTGKGAARPESGPDQKGSS